MVVLAVVQLWVGALGCSSRAPAPTDPERPVAGRGSAAPEGPGDATPPADTRASEVECHAAFDHMIEIDLKERPADQQLPPAQVAELRQYLHESHLARCREQDRVVIACIMAATTSAAVKECDR